MTDNRNDLGKTLKQRRVESEALGRLDPYAARVLSQEPVEVQRAVIAIVTGLRSIGKGMAK